MDDLDNISSTDTVCNSPEKVSNSSASNFVQKPDKRLWTNQEIRPSNVQSTSLNKSSAKGKVIYFCT